MKNRKDLEDPRTGVKDITPVEAAVMLEKQNVNRRVRNYVVNRIAYDLEHEAFKYNGEAVVFDWDERLVQGQHRLRACVMSGVPITVMVVYLPKQIKAVTVATTYDRVSPRSAGDALYISGQKSDESLMASLVKKQLAWGRYGTLSRHGAAGGEQGYQMQHVTHDDIEAYWMQNQTTLNDAVEAVQLYQRLLRGLMPTSLAAFVYYRASMYDQKKADTWLHGVATGEKLDMDDVLWDLRRKLQADATSKSRLTDEAKAAYAIQSWNAHATGAKGARLAWDASRQSFPAFVGESKAEPKKAKAKAKKAVKAKAKKERAA